MAVTNNIEPSEVKLSPNMISVEGSEFFQKSEGDVERCQKLGLQYRVKGAKVKRVKKVKQLLRKPKVSQEIGGSSKCYCCGLYHSTKGEQCIDSVNIAMVKVEVNESDLTENEKRLLTDNEDFISRGDIAHWKKRHQYLYEARGDDDLFRHLWQMILECRVSQIIQSTLRRKPQDKLCNQLVKWRAFFLTNRGIHALNGNIDRVWALKELDALARKAKHLEDNYPKMTAQAIKVEEFDLRTRTNNLHRVTFHGKEARCKCEYEFCDVKFQSQQVGSDKQTNDALEHPNQITEELANKPSSTRQQKVLGIGAHSGSINEVCSIPSRFKVVNWLQSEPRGKLLTEFEIRPDLCEITPRGEILHTNLSYYADLHQYWRGDLNFDLEIISTKVHQGQLFVVWVPPGIKDGDNDLESYINVPSTTIDVSEQPCTRVKVPFTAPSQWKRTVSRGRGYVHKPEFSTLGRLKIFVQNSLVCPDMVAQNVSINIYTSAGSNFNFSVPRNPTSFRLRANDVNDVLVPEIKFQSKNAPIDDYRKTNDMGNSRSIREQVSLDPHNGNNTGFENFSNVNQNMKAIKIFSGGFDTSVAPYKDIARIKFPQAFMDNEKLTISGVDKYNYYSSMDFELEIRIPPTMFHQGALIVFFVPEAYGTADPVTRRFTRGTVMNFPHCVINMCGETKKSFKVPFASIFDSYYKGSSVDMKGTIVVQVWNQLQTGPNMSPKIEYSLWCTPMNVKMGFPIPKWQSADSGVEEELVNLPQGRDNRADYLVDRCEDNMYSQLTIPAYVDTQQLLDVHQYPQFVGARHWWLRAPFAYSSGGNELTFLGDSDKTFKGKIAVQLITQEDPMMTKTEFDPQSVKLADAKIRSNPRTTFWFPQESNKLTVKIPQNDIFPIQKQNMINETVQTLPSWIQLVPMSKETATEQPTITVLHQVQPDFKLYMLGGMPITYTTPIGPPVPPSPNYPAGWQDTVIDGVDFQLVGMDDKVLKAHIGSRDVWSALNPTPKLNGILTHAQENSHYDILRTQNEVAYAFVDHKPKPIPSGWVNGSIGDTHFRMMGMDKDQLIIQVINDGSADFDRIVRTLRPATPITSVYSKYDENNDLLTLHDGTQIQMQRLMTLPDPNDEVPVDDVSVTIPNSPDADDVSDLFDQITFQGRGFRNPTWKKMKEARDRLNCFKKQKVEKEPCQYCDGWRECEKAGQDVPDSWALHCPVHRPRFQMKSTDETDDVEADLKDKLSAATIFFEDEKKSKHYHFTPIMMKLVNKLMKNLEGKSQIKIVDANSEWNEIHNSDFIALTTQQKFRRGELFEVLAPKEQTTVYIEPIRGAPSRLIEALCHYLKFRTNIPIVVATQNRAMKRRILEREWTYGQVVIHYGGNRVKAFCEVDFDETVKDQMIKSSFNIRKSYREIDHKGHRVNFIKFQGLTAENSLNAVTAESFKSGIAGFASMIFGYMKTMGISIGNLIMSGINKIRELIVNVIGKFIVDIIKNVFGELWTQAYDWIKDNLITFFVVTLFLTLLITGPKMALAFITVLGGYYFYANILEPMIRDFMDEIGQAITFMGLSDLMDTVKTKFSGMTEKQAKLFTKIVGLSVVSIFSTITTVSVPKGPVQSILQNVSARACYDSVSSMIYSVGEIVASYFTPEDDDKMKMAATLVEKYDGLELMKQFDEFEQNDCFTQRWLDHRKEGYTPRECIFKAQAFYTEIAPLSEELKKLADGPYMYKQINRVPNIYKKLTKISDLSATRSEPVGIWFAGEAGVGKSLLLSECLPKMVVMGLNLATGETAAKHIYSIPMDQDQKYYDGYANQIYSYLDDFSARNDGEDYNNILQLISTSIAPLPMAELGDKGTVFTSEFVAVSSNQYQVQSTKVFKLDDPFIRRFPISYKVVVKKEFNLTEGQVDLEGLPVAQKLDFKKFVKHLAEKSAAGLTMDQIFNDVWVFKPLNLSTGFVHTRNDNIRSEEEHTCTEVLRRILETYKSRKVGRATVAKQTNTLKVSVNIANIEDDVQPWEPQDLYRKTEELGTAKDDSKVSDNQVREVLTGVVRLAHRGEIVQIRDAIKNNLAVQQEQVEEIVKEVEYPSDDLPQFKGLKPEFQSLGGIVARTGLTAAGKYLARRFRMYGYEPIMTKAVDLNFGTKPGTVNLDIKGFWDDWIGGVAGMQCRKQLKSEDWYDYVRKLEAWLDKNTKWSGSQEERPWVFPHKTTQFLKDTYTQQEFDEGIINCYCLHASLYIRENETDHRPGMYVYEPETLGTGYSGDDYQRCWNFVDYINKHATSLDQTNKLAREKQWISVADALQVQAKVVNEFLIVPPKLSFWEKARKWATPVLKIGLSIFTMGYCVKIMTSLMSGFFSMLGFDAGSEAAYTKKGKIPKMKTDKTHLPKFQGLDQGILNKIKSATIKIYHPTTQKFISHALVLDQRFVAVNKHVLDQIIEDGMYSFYLRCPTSKACLHIPFRGQMSRGIHLGKETDTVIIKTPQPIPRAANIAKYLSSMTTMSSIAGAGFTYDVHHLVPSGGFEIRKVIPGQLRKFQDVNLYWVEEGTLPVYDGDCGSPYMTPGQVLGTSEYIVGIHAAGINGRSHSAFFSPLSMNMYNEARRELDRDGMALHVEAVDFQARNITKLGSVEEMNPNFRQMGKISGLNPYTEIVPEDCLDDQRISTPPNRDGINAIESYGACSINGNHICNGQITTSEIRKSKIHSKEIWNDGFEPAKLDVNILLDRFTVYNRPNTQNVPRDMYEWCVKEYFDQMKTITVDVERRPLTTDEVLNVSSTYPHTFPFDRNSSAGFWNVVSMKKKDLIDGIIQEDDEGIERNHFTLKDTKVHPWIKKTLKQHIADEEESIRKGNQMFTFWNATLKDELRSHEKVAAGRTRQFQSGSFDHSFLCKKYYGAFADWFRSNPGFTLMHGIGNDKDSCWSYYHKRLMEMGGNGFDIDGKDYGVSINGQASQFFQEVTELWYKQSDLWNEGDQKARGGIMEAVRHSMHIVAAYLCGTTTGNNDGFFLTDVYNSITNIFYQLVAFCGSYKMKYGVLPEHGLYMKNVRTLTYGDDVIHGVSSWALEFFNRQTCAEWMNPMGIIITSAAKTAGLEKFNKIEDLTFLKSSFIKEKSVVRAPMPEGVIFKELNWYKKTCEEARLIRRDICHSAVAHASHHSEEFYNNLVAQISSQIEKQDPELKELFKPKSYDQTTQELSFKQDLFDRSMNGRDNYKHEEEKPLEEGLKFFENVNDLDKYKKENPKFQYLESIRHEKGEEEIGIFFTVLWRSFLAHANVSMAIFINTLFFFLLAPLHAKMSLTILKRRWLSFSSTSRMHPVYHVVAPINEEVAFDRPYEKVIFGFTEFVDYVNRGVSIPHRLPALVLHLFNAYLMNNGGHFAIRVFLHMCFNVCASFYEVQQLSDVEKRQELKRCYLALPKEHPLKPVLSELMKEL